MSPERWYGLGITFCIALFYSLRALHSAIVSSFQHSNFRRRPFDPPSPIRPIAFWSHLTGNRRRDATSHSWQIKLRYFRDSRNLTNNLNTFPCPSMYTTIRQISNSFRAVCNHAPSANYSDKNMMNILFDVPRYHGTSPSLCLPMKGTRARSNKSKDIYCTETG